MNHPIAACYVVHNEAELIAESVRSVKAFVDQVILVDSTYHTNPTDSTHSTDNTRELAEAACDPVPVTYVESDRKMALDEARNLSISLVPVGGFVLTIDGDETLLGERHLLEEMADEIHSGSISGPVGISVFTAALKFVGHAPGISEEAYRNLPVMYTRGVQPRLVPAFGAEWHRVPGGETYGLYVDHQLPKPEPDQRAIIINHRTRQTYAAYQHDYIWETAERRG